MNFEHSVIVGDLHYGAHGKEPNAYVRSAIAALTDYTLSYGARLLSAGDLADRKLMKKSIEEAKAICRSVAETLQRYCEDSLQKVHRVVGNHDASDELHQWFPGVFFKNHGAYFTSDEHDPGHGLFMTHGHLLSGKAGKVVRGELQKKGATCDRQAVEEILTDPTLSNMALHSWTNTTGVLFSSLLHALKMGNAAEQMIFAFVARRNALEQQLHMDEMQRFSNDQPEVCISHSLAGLVAECSGHFGSVGVFGHDHDPRILERKTSYGKRVIVANAGGSLPSNEGPLRFLEAKNRKIALHSIRENGQIERGEWVLF